MKTQLNRWIGWGLVISIFLVSAEACVAQQPSDSAKKSVTNNPIILKGIYRKPSFEGYKTNPDRLPELAVMRSLRWFKKTQNSDGAWGDETEPKALATAIALQAFLQHGEKPTSKEFGTTIERGLKFLVSAREPNRLTQQKNLCAIENGVCAVTLFEAYAATRLTHTLPAATHAIRLILESQRPSGLWSTRYEKDQGTNDLEASMWQILALKSALFVGVPNNKIKPALQKGAEAMKILLQEDEKKLDVGPVLLALQIAGIDRDADYRAVLLSLDGLQMNWGRPEFVNPVFNWYCINKAKFIQGGNLWSDWNMNLKPTLVKMQIIEEESIEGPFNGKKEDAGCWVSPGKNERFGKIYSTALCCMMLEIHYAFLPGSWARMDNFPDGAGSR